LALSRNLQSEIPVLNEWIDRVETQLDAFETTEALNTHLDLQIGYVKVCFIFSM
jgi:hypothetical protein